MKLLVFDTHPVQYRVPIWQALEARQPGCVRVVYGSDCSVRGHSDQGFGRVIAWDDPLLSGYAQTVLGCERGRPLSGWGSLTGAGVGGELDRHRPAAVLLTGLNYRYDLVAYLRARNRGIPIWLRAETQDEAFRRPAWKAAIRSLVYRLVYQGVRRAFYIGELNRAHYVRHGVSEDRLRPARYGTVDRCAGLSTDVRRTLRLRARAQAGLRPEHCVVGFAGKLIPKKCPGLLFSCLEHLPEAVRSRTALYFLGSGELEGELRLQADAAFQRFGVRTWFAGFANQSELASHYLAMDVLVLPSQRAGETWGLVANEAMQAGCGVVVSKAVGCGADFGSWERFRVFPEGQARELAGAVGQLAGFERCFDWARNRLEAYSVAAAAEALLREIDRIPAPSAGCAAAAI